MAQEQQEIRSVNWNEVFAFTHIFKCFRMAIQPSKLLLAATALILMFLVGLAMDTVWGWGDSYALVGQKGQPGEIARRASMSPAAFDKWRSDQMDGRLSKAAHLRYQAAMNLRSFEDFGKNLEAEIKNSGKPDDPMDLGIAFGKQMSEYGKTLDANTSAKEADILKKAQDNHTSWSALLLESEKDFSKAVSKFDDLLDKADTEARKSIKDSNSDSKQKDLAVDAVKRQMKMAARARTATKLAFGQDVLEVKGMCISNALVTYEWNCIGGAVGAAARGDFTGGLKQYRDMLENQRDIQPMAPDLSSLQRPNVADAPAGGPSCGVLLYGLLAYRGVTWLLCTHWIYALIYLAIALGVIALFGGAVNRMAALHFAREEKISAAQALKFAAGKFLSFYTAPLIPVVIIFVLGLLMGLGGLLLNWPIADWFGGLFFLLAILAGLVIAFLLTGLVGGVGLMYPTIAAEGSDSFDAISRSYSYVFARPWRAILYGAVAAVYGAITYLFVRVFVYLALAATHWFVGTGVFANGNSLSPDADRLDVIWTAPTPDNLFGNFSWAAMDGWDKIPAFLIGCWVFLLACLVAGYLLSYAASATNVIYFLLRRKVDATDLDDVYVEEVTETVEPAPTVQPTAASSAPAQPAASAPATPEAPAAPAPNEPPGPEGQTPPAGETKAPQ